MVFSSPEFLFCFLPYVVLGYYLLLRAGWARFIAPYIFVVSLFYYGWWRPQNVWIILASIIFNYGMGKAIAANGRRRMLFALGVAANLGLLGVYKYLDFCIGTVNALLQTDLPLQGILLPIGISFFTFQQIAYLADIQTGRHDPANEGFADYCCFVCFFPQLVAGPIVHHQEMMPQFLASRNHQVNWENIFNGLVLLSIGLAKKVLIADNLSPLVHHCFDVRASMTFLEACFGSLSYTMQLYFDFSGYSDMAIGLALLFNIHLPWNFDSPYKATNIQDFWRRWHITLSRWLRDYLYIPLGGNRSGTGRTLCNLFLTFLLGGLWHGAAWTFVLWGAMHGMALVVQRIWAQLWGKKMPALLGWLLTFGFVNLAWVVFRAPNFERLGKFVDAFLGYNGLFIREVFWEELMPNINFGSPASSLCFLSISILIVFFVSNSQSIAKMSPKLRLALAVVGAAISAWLIILPGATPEFIYSQF